MGGYVTIVRRDGRDIDPGLLPRLAALMSSFSPDGVQTFRSANIGVVQCELRTSETTGTAAFEVAASSVVAGDVRLDARDDLVRALDVAPATATAGLLLAAAQRWGRRMPERLRGDFSICLLDRASGEVLALRDQLGVIPFYYVDTPELFACSNVVDVLRALDEVSDELDEPSVGDFLLFGHHRDPHATSFAAIRRLAAGEMLEANAHGVRVSRYHEFAPVPFPQALDVRACVEEFRRVMSRAIAERAGGPATIFMSGGLDSTTVAAFMPPAEPLHAITVGYRDLIPGDRELEFAAVAANHLSIPHDALNGDVYELFERCGSQEFRRPAPAEHPLLAVLYDQSRLALGRGRIAFYGDGSDVALLPGRAPWKERPIVSTLRATLLGGRLQRRLPRGLGLRQTLFPLRPAAEPALPGWLDPDFVRRAGLAERLRAAPWELRQDHSFRSAAVTVLRDPYWSAYFEGLSPGAMRMPLVSRSPFFAFEVVSFLLSLPSIPWCTEKMILREAARGMLPELIRTRPKTPLAGSPVEMLLRRSPDFLRRTVASPELAPFVLQARLRETVAPEWADLRPIALTFWLKNGRLPPIVDNTATTKETL